MKHHKDLDELLHNSPIRKARRIKTWIILAIIFLALIVGTNLYISSQAQAYKESAMAQIRQRNIATNLLNDKTIAYFEGIKQLTANYTK